MEPRRIQKVGYSTLSVSIPMNWAKKMNVKKGDIVFLNEETDGALRIQVFMLLTLTSAIILLF
jgi:phosphate uptake regulator